MGEKKTEIDIHFDFTTDTRGYWENFWDNNNGLGARNIISSSGVKNSRMGSRWN